MRVLQLTGTAGADGLLHLTVPAEPGVELEVAVVLQPKSPIGGGGRKPTPEELGWPPGYFETVIGSIDDDTFVAPTRSGTRPKESLE